MKPMTPKQAKEGAIMSVDKGEFVLTIALHDSFWRRVYRAFIMIFQKRLAIRMRFDEMADSLLRARKAAKENLQVVE